MFAGSLLINKIVCFAIGFILLQGSYGYPPDSEIDPLERATTPPEKFLIFNDDFSSRDLNRFFAWFNPDLGVVTNGVLLTKQEAQEQFTQLFAGPDSNNLLGMSFYFNVGLFTGDNTYMADCWLELKMWENGQEHWYKMHHQLVFKIRSEGWYLIQWEFIPPDIGLPLDYQSLLEGDEGVPEQLRNAAPLLRGSTTSLAGVSVWPLLIGTSYVDEGELHPIEGTTPSGSKWSLADAVAAHKPTVLYFFSVEAYFIYNPEALEAEMDFLSGLYDTFGYQDMYIFGVTDASRETAQWMGDAGYNDFALLVDDGSMMHATMNIAEHPFMVVLDAEGTVVALCKTFNPSVLPIIENRIRAAVNSASGHN